MYLQLADGGLGQSKFLRGLAAVSTGGASEMARGVFGKKKGGSINMINPCSCENETNIIKVLKKKLKNYKADTALVMKQLSVSYDPTTGVATIISSPATSPENSVDPQKYAAWLRGQQQLADEFSLSSGVVDLVGGALKATPYGAAASAALNVAKGIFKKGGVKKAVDTGAQNLNKYSKENADLKKKVANKTKVIASLKKQRYYYGGGGLAAGIVVGAMIGKKL